MAPFCRERRVANKNFNAMNIDLLSKMVKELILDSDCVALPGFGVFVAEIVPASFSDKGYTLNPPYRRLHFRARDVQDDSLAALYASSNNLEMGVARTIVRDFTVELKKVLQKNKVVIFPGLGRLRATKENNFFFVPDENLDIYPEGFGLEPISLKTHQETGEELAAAVEGLAEILKEEVVSNEAAAGASAEPAIETASEPETVPEAGPVLEACDAVEVPEETVESSLDAAGTPECPVPVEQDSREEQESTDSQDRAEKPEQDKEQDKKSDKGQEKGSGKESDRKPDKEYDRGHGRMVLRKVLIIAGIVAGVLALALLAFLVVAEACPDFMDSLLYNKEQLEILNRWEQI